MAEQDSLTTHEDFIVRRLKAKVCAAKHQLMEALKAAAVLSPDLLARTGMREAVGVLEKELGNLRACVLARTPEEPLG
jgi:hypothetical protein